MLIQQDVRIKGLDASTVPKSAGKSIQIFALKIQMHSDAPNWWIKHTVWTFKPTNNTQKCWIKDMNIQIKCSNTPIIPKNAESTQINIQIQHMNETDSQKCSFEQKNVIIKHLKLSTVPKMLNRKFKNIKWRFSCIYNAPKNVKQNIQIFKLQVQIHYDTSKSRFKHMKLQIQYSNHLWFPKMQNQT